MYSSFITNTNNVSCIIIIMYSYSTVRTGVTNIGMSLVSAVYMTRPGVHWCLVPAQCSISCTVAQHLCVMIISEFLK